MAVTDMLFRFPCLLLLLVNAVAAYLTPYPPGQYNVTLTTGPLTDHSRNRTLMLSIFQPARCAADLAFHDMPKKTAEFQGPFLEQAFNVSQNFAPLFEDARLPVCAHLPDGCSLMDEFPILLFSPGYSVPRHYYNVLVSAVASEGFTVISIDYPGDANVIVYPDGDAVYNPDIYNVTWGHGEWRLIAELMYTHLADVSFLIDQMSNATAMGQLLPDRGARPVLTDRIATFGHSEGGATAILAAGKDDRIRGAVNWDGSIAVEWKNVTTPGLPEVTQPVLFTSHDSTFEDPTWQKTWPKLKGPKLVVHIPNATHETYSDVPTLLQSAGYNLEPFADLLGTIAPAEMVRILAAFTATWMKGIFAGKEDEAQLEKMVQRFPGTSIMKKANF